MSKRKPVRPAALRSVEEFGIELSFEELGQCLGMSRYRAKALCVDNGVPTIARGKYKKVHRAVAAQVITGAWWTGVRA